MCVREANLICSFAIGHLSLRSGASPWVECWFDSEPEPRARYAVGVRMNLSRMSPSRPGRTFDKVQLSAYYWIRIRDHDHPAAMAQVIHITLTAETDHPISAGPSHRSLGSTESFHRKVWKAKTVVLVSISASRHLLHTIPLKRAPPSSPVAFVTNPNPYSWTPLLGPGL